MRDIRMCFFFCPAQKNRAFYLRIWKKSSTFAAAKLFETYMKKTMKKLSLLFVAILMTAGVMAEGHMKFKGVEINGTLKSFVANMEKRGCESGENILGVSLIKANFAGIEMMVYPQTTSQSQTVYAVVAGTSKINEKVSLNAQYDELKALLIQKYGAGKEITIADGWYRNSINVLERGNTQQALLFETDNGKIYLYIHKFNSYDETSSINVQYIDKANDQLRLREANTDI